MNEENNLKDTKLYKETYAKLETLFLNVTSKKDVVSPNVAIPMYRYERYTSFVRNARDFYNRWLETETTSELLQVLKREFGGREKKQETMVKMLAYLGLVESMGVNLIDMVLLMFVANGTEIHSRKNYIKHIETLDELREIDLVEKQRFLKDKGLVEFSKFINREDRNSIAHLKFKIGEDGAITTLKDRAIKIDDDINKFWNGTRTIRLIFEEIGFWNWMEKQVNRHHEKT